MDVRYLGSDPTQNSRAYRFDIRIHGRLTSVGIQAATDSKALAFACNEPHRRPGVPDEMHPTSPWRDSGL